MNGKDLVKTIKDHMLTVLCVIAILLLFLPMVEIVTTTESDFIGTMENKTKISGFTALGYSFFTYFLLVGPIVLIGMNYIQQLEKYKGLLAILIPVACIICLIIVLISSKSFASSLPSMESSAASVTSKSHIMIGSIMLFITYIATIIAGAVTYHDFTLDKAGLEKLKESGSNFLDSAKNKIQSYSQSAPADYVPEQNDDGSAGVQTERISAPAKPVKKALNMNHMDQVLQMIEKLSKMKDAGILTEEEFAAKKKQLLEEI